MGQKQNKIEVVKNQQLKNQYAKFEQEMIAKLKEWEKQVKKRNNDFIQKHSEVVFSISSGEALKQIQTILKPILHSDLPTYKVIQDAFLGTIELLQQSATAQSKVRQGYYLASTGSGIVRVQYYFFYRLIEERYFLNHKSQTQVCYGYSISPYNEKYSLLQLGCLVDGMYLNNEQKKIILVGLTKFATDVDQMSKIKKQKQSMKETDEYW